MNDVIDMDEMLGRNDISSRFFKRLAEQRRVSRYKVGKLRRAGARTPAKQISARAKRMSRILNIQKERSARKYLKSIGSEQSYMPKLKIRKRLMNRR